MISNKYSRDILISGKVSAVFFILQEAVLNGNNREILYVYILHGKMMEKNSLVVQSGESKGGMAAELKIRRHFYHDNISSPYVSVFNHS